MTKEGQIMYVEMERLLARTLEELTQLLVNLSGSLEDILYGTHIKIPAGAGYVKLYKSVDSLQMSLWLSETIMDKEPAEIQENLNHDEE